MKPKISVIIPVYNTGSILRETIESVLCQTFTDFELILVDDGSNDISGRICDEYKKIDKRVVVVHQKNGGICAARNTGIGISKGEYITFCDHDDIYLPRKLEVQYMLAESSGADIVNVGYETIYDDRPAVSMYLDVNCKCEEDVRNHFFDITDRAFGTIWIKLYRASSLKAYMSFDAKYTHGHEDINFNYHLMKYIKKYYSSNEILYKHVVRKALSTSAKVHKDVVCGMKDELEKYCELIKYFNLDVTKKYRIPYVNKLSQLFRSLAVYMIKCSADANEFNNTISEIKYIPCHITFMECLCLRSYCIKERIILYMVEKKYFNLLYNMMKTWFTCVS